MAGEKPTLNHTGRYKLNGRKKGVKNKRTLERERAMAEAHAKVEKSIKGAFKGDAHALLIAVYKDPNQEWQLRLDAAKTAIRYEKPALQSITLDGKLNVTHDDFIDGLQEADPG